MNFPRRFIKLFNQNRAELGYANKFIFVNQNSFLHEKISRQTVAAISFKKSFRMLKDFNILIDQNDMICCPALVFL